MAAGLTSVQLNALFGAITGNASGIATALPHNVTHNIGAAAATWNCDTNNTGVVVLGIVTRLAAMTAVANNGLNGVNVAAGSPNVLTFEATATIGGLTVGPAAVTAANAATHAQPECVAFFNRVLASYNSAPQWIFDLCAADQIRKLSPDNVTNYYAGLGVDRVNGSAIISIISPLSTILARIRADAGAAGRLSNNDWMRYHTSATSTPQLVQKAIDFVGTSIPGFFSVATTAAVTAAIAEPWRKDLADAIPRKAVAATHAILTALRQCPRDWYQGNKAKDSFPSSIYAGWISIAAKLQDLIINQVAINASTTLAGLAAAAPGNCLNC